MTAPEWNGQPFTHTWFWGAFDGDIFHELMMTKAFFERQDEDVRTPIPMPAAFPEAGWYPTEEALRTSTLRAASPSEDSEWATERDNERNRSRGRSSFDAMVR